MPIEIYKGLFVGPGKIFLDDLEIDAIISLDCGAKPYINREVDNYCFDILDFNVEPIWNIGYALKTINALLNTGKKVYLHCRAGCGRTGTVSIAFLILKGYTLDEAYNKFIRIRGCGPEDTVQLRFLETFEEAVKLMGGDKALEELIKSKNLNEFIARIYQYR